MNLSKDNQKGHSNRNSSMVDALRPAPAEPQIQAGYKDCFQRDTAERCLTYSATTRLLAAEHAMPVLVDLANPG
jgi:hypothetical protein